MTAVPSILTAQDALRNSGGNWTLVGGTIPSFLFDGAQFVPTAGATVMTATLASGLYAVYGATKITAHARMSSNSPNDIDVVIAITDGVGTVLASGSVTVHSGDTNDQVDVNYGSGASWLSTASVGLKVTVTRHDGSAFTPMDGVAVSFDQGFAIANGLYYTFATTSAATPTSTPAIAHVGAAQVTSAASISLTSMIPGGAAQVCASGEVIACLLWNNADETTWNGAGANAPAGFLLAESTHDPANTNARFYLYLKVAGAAEPASYTFSLPAATTAVAVFESASSADANHVVHLCQWKGAGNNSATAPAIDIPADQGLLGALMDENGNAGGGPFWTGLPPAGFTLQVTLGVAPNQYGPLGLTKNASPAKGTTTAAVNVFMGANAENIGAQMWWGPTMPPGLGLIYVGSVVLPSPAGGIAP